MMEQRGANLKHTLSRFGLLGRLGLGLGNLTASQVDALIEKLTAASATMCLLSTRADGTNPGVNAPLTNPMVDIIGSNDATLVGFAGTTADGYDVVVTNRINEIDNYDFSNGTSGWITSFSTTVVDNLKAINTANGTNTQPRIVNQTQEPFISGHKIFTFARIRVTNSIATEIKIAIDGSGAGAIIPNIINNPIENQWYDLYNISTPIVTSGNIQLYVFHKYTDNASSLGKLLEIEGDILRGGGVFTLNLTVLDAKYPAMGLLTKTAEEINAMKYELLALQKVTTMLKADGVNSLGKLVGNAGLDLIGLNDFAIHYIFKTPTTIQNTSGIFSAGNATNFQEVLLYTAFGGRFNCRIRGTYLTLTAGTVISGSTLYSALFYRIGGVLKLKLNGVELYSVANTADIRAITQIAILANHTDGTNNVFQNFSDNNSGSVTTFYNGATGLNETLVDTACDALDAIFF